jgi:hypothetical protein|tara:strand:+ start:51 stop:359 length:309 start_codon:yes stop_codon:yes gene_type:complete
MEYIDNTDKNYQSLKDKIININLLITKNNDIIKETNDEIFKLNNQQKQIELIIIEKQNLLNEKLNENVKHNAILVKSNNNLEQINNAISNLTNILNNSNYNE